jgi:hypothetical protein
MELLEARGSSGGCLPPDLSVLRYVLLLAVGIGALVDQSMYTGTGSRAAHAQCARRTKIFRTDCAVLKAYPCRYSRRGGQERWQTARGPGGSPWTCPVIEISDAKSKQDYFIGRAPFIHECSGTPRVLLP